MNEETVLAATARFHSAFEAMHVRRFLRAPPRALRATLIAGCGAAVLAGCSGEPRTAGPMPLDPSRAHALIEQALPRTLADRAGWAADLYAGFTVQSIEINRDDICAVAAVIEQESGFHVNPVVPGLPAIARREIDARAERAGVPKLIVHAALDLNSHTGRTYGARIDAARTEKDLSDIFEDFIGAVPMGQTLFADRNPVRTRGPMQVNVAFARQYAAVRPYPYPVKTDIAEELFTRRGGLYFGIAHLLAYRAPYDRYIFRFADFNAGQFASRNAAFQKALSEVSGISVVPDGALLPHGAGATGAGATEAALRSLAERLNMSEGTIHAALEQGRSAEFERTTVYLRVFALAEQASGNTLDRASIPRIELHSPKITRRLTTEWYARRVNQRYESCLKNLPEQR